MPLVCACCTASHTLASSTLALSNFGVRRLPSRERLWWRGVRLRPRGVRLDELLVKLGVFPQAIGSAYLREPLHQKERCVACGDGDNLHGTSGRLDGGGVEEQATAYTLMQHE